MATFTFTIETYKKVYTFFAIKNILPFLLKSVLYIYHFVQFKKVQAKIKTFLNFSNEVNIMTLAYLLKLSFKAQSINVKAQKTNCFTFKMFKIIPTIFQIDNKLNRACFF